MSFAESRSLINMRPMAGSLRKHSHMKPRRTLFKSRGNKLMVGPLSQSAALIKNLIKNIEERNLTTTIPQSAVLNTRPTSRLQTEDRHQDENADCRSVRSNHSKMSCRSKMSTRSNFQKSVQQIQPTKVFFDSELLRPPRDMSQLELQRYLDKLLKERIALMIDVKNNRPCRQQLVFELNQKLDAVTKLITQKTLQTDEIRSNMSIFRSIDKKVELIERILSQKYIESDILRSFYQLSMYGRTEYGKLGCRSTNQLIKDNTDINSSCIPDKTICSPHRSFLTKSSVNQECYKKPERQSYKIYRQEKQKYRFKPQSLPNSSYKENFLNYSGVLTFKADAHSKWEQHAMKTSYHASVGSTYNRDYVHKIQPPAQYRDLDSFKDKIKTLKIKYNSHKDLKSSASDLSRTIAKLERQYNMRPASKPTMTRSFQNQFTSTAQNQINHTIKDAVFVPSSPVNARMNKLERFYRYSYHKMA